MPSVLREARADELDAVGAMMVAAYAEYAPPAPVRDWLDYEDEIRDVRRRLTAAAQRRRQFIAD